MSSFCTGCKWWVCIQSQDCTDFKFWYCQRFRTHKLSRRKVVCGGRNKEQ